MNRADLFEQFWMQYQNRPIDRKSYFKSLSKSEQTHLINSFYDNGWRDLFIQNHINAILDNIQLQYNIDLLDLRIQAIKHGRVFLISTSVWEDIENMFTYLDSCYDIDIIFGGLTVSSWGRNRQCYLIKARQINKWRPYE